MPIRIRNTPARTVAITRPSIPSLATIPATIVANAAGWTGDLYTAAPKAEITNPATIAVKYLPSGPTPDASARAIDGEGR